MADNLFDGLPPPSSELQPERRSSTADTDAEKTGGPPSSPFLKSSLKQPKPAQSVPQPQGALAAAPKSAMKRPKSGESAQHHEAPATGKRLRFKTTTDASEAQVIEAMQKITSHIKNPAKFAKASKLAVQLINSGSVKPGTADYFFAILEAAMSSPTPCTDASVRADYHMLFSAAQGVAECLNKKQRNLLTTWTIKAVTANDLFTDDSFVFSKTATRIKEAIADLPVSTEEEDIEEATSLEDAAAKDSKGNQTKTDDMAEENKIEDVDPFGLDALISTAGNTEKKGLAAKVREEEDAENKRFLKSKREALITCLEIAARRYRIPWCQTVIDILVKHAFENVSRFTPKQREAIEKLWGSIREQHIRRKQGKSVTGKLDVTAFEWLQNKYSNEKMSIRHSVGASGDRRATQWLG